MNDELDVTDRERKEAYRKLRRASDLMDDAATDLGFTDVHDMARAGEMDLSSREADGLRAVTNAHSWLNNGMIGAIHPEG